MNQSSKLAELTPGEDPIPFEESIIPSGKLIHSGILSPDLQQYYFTLSDKDSQHFDVMVCERKKLGWSEPTQAFFNTEYNEHGTAFSPDGSYIYFSSTRPVGIAEIANTWRIWRSKKFDEKWCDRPGPGVIHNL